MSNESVPCADIQNDTFVQINPAADDLSRNLAVLPTRPIIGSTPEALRSSAINDSQTSKSGDRISSANRGSSTDFPGYLEDDKSGCGSTSDIADSGQLSSPTNHLLRNLMQRPLIQAILNGTVDALSKAGNVSACGRRDGHTLPTRWANTATSTDFSGRDLFGLPFPQLYARQDFNRKAHPLQMYATTVRKFNICGTLQEMMQIGGAGMFYRQVCDVGIDENIPSFTPDFTLLDDLSSITASASYLFAEVSRTKGHRKADMARSCFRRGFSRPIEAGDLDDWDAFRTELRCCVHITGDFDHVFEDDVVPVAVSYLGKSRRISRRFHSAYMERHADEEEVRQAGLDKGISNDCLDDIQWSQLIQSCIEISRLTGKSKVRIWLDRLVMLGLRRSEIRRRYQLVEWTDFGLMPYAVCPVIRLYDQDHVDSGIDFWRKLEAVMGIAGKGLFVDDYDLQKIDTTLFYEPQMYTSLHNGVARIGGEGLYLRAVTLAMATAVLTDGVSVWEGTEDVQTELIVQKWKAWALRTIGEGAYSHEHSSMMRSQRDEFHVGLVQFRIICFWEAYVSSSSQLTHASYVNMTVQWSKKWRRAQKWDGVVEWVGMVAGACVITEREQILQFLNSGCEIEAWTAPSGHTATLLKLCADCKTASCRDDGIVLKRTIALRLCRFASSTEGYVTAVAEATSFLGKKTLPWWMFFHPDPESDQRTRRQTPCVCDGEKGNRENGKRRCAVVCDHAAIKVVPLVPQWLLPFVWIPILIAVIGISILTDIGVGGTVGIIFGVFSFGFMIPVGAKDPKPLLNEVRISARSYVKWPWISGDNVGEGIFDNLLMHGLFDAGINRSSYRRLRGAQYREIKWS